MPQPLSLSLSDADLNAIKNIVLRPQFKPCPCERDDNNRVPSSFRALTSEPLNVVSHLSHPFHPSQSEENYAGFVQQPQPSLVVTTSRRIVPKMLCKSSGSIFVITTKERRPFALLLRQPTCLLIRSLHLITFFTHPFFLSAPLLPHFLPLQNDSHGPTEAVLRCK